jgi:glycerophosphoryl diester phosphodiesterase
MADRDPGVDEAFEIAALPPVIGHRGAALFAPENTLAGLRTAARMGASWVETDVKLTADGVPIIMHDDTLDRTTDGSGPVADTPYEVLARLDAGGWFGPDFAGERVPTLLEWLGLAAEFGLGVNVEIKPNPGEAVSTVERVVDILTAHVSAGGPILISSFSRDSILAARDLLPRVPRAVLVKTAADDIDGFLAEARAVALNPHQRLLADKADVTRLTEAGYGVIPFTVNDAARCAELLDWGVSSVVTDDPSILTRKA